MSKPRGVFKHLQIYARRERVLVGLADLALAPLAAVGRLFGRAPAPKNIQRVLLLRLERIGDLLMTLEAIADVRRALPEAEIDLAVGSWNLPLAELLPGITRLDVADVGWLAREGRGLPWPALLARARTWRRRRYDLVINFEPDIRTNLLAWLTNSPRRAGYGSAGGGAFLTDAGTFDPATHVADNARQLVARALGSGLVPPTATPPRLTFPADAAARAAAVLAAQPRPWIGVHASGGREIKQWHLGRFADVGRVLAGEFGGTIVLTGAPGDRDVVDAVKAGLGGVNVVDASGVLDLPALGALLERLDVLITGDTGPMHLAAAIGTPVVALFGPSDPRRYGPRSDRQRVLRVQIWCSPCGRVRLPPERCQGHVPDCLDGITVEAVLTATRELLEWPGARSHA